MDQILAETLHTYNTMAFKDYEFETTQTVFYNDYVLVFNFYDTKAIQQEITEIVRLALFMGWLPTTIDASKLRAPWACSGHQ